MGFLLSPFLTQAAVSFLKHACIIKTNRNKNFSGERDRKVKEKHLHKRTIATVKYLPFATNNQR